MKPNVNDSTDSSDRLPDWFDEVDQVVVLHKRVTVSRSAVTEEMLEDLDLDTELLDDPDFRSIEFEKGDRLPLEVARDCWSAFSDRLAAFDEDEERLDEPAGSETVDSDLFTVGLK